MIWWWLVCLVVVNTVLMIHNIYHARAITHERLALKIQTSSRARIEETTRWKIIQQDIGFDPAGNSSLVRLTCEIGTPIVRLYLRSPS